MEKRSRNEALQAYLVCLPAAKLKKHLLSQWGVFNINV